MDLETLAIKYQVQGENEVRASLVQIGGQTDQLAATVESDTARMGGAFSGLGAQMEGMSHRFEHSGVLIAFAVENMLNGQQTGIQRALHSIALLGFAFGPVAGAIATGAALALEEIKNFVEKAEKEVKDFQKTMGDAVNAGDIAKLMKAKEDLMTGTPFDPKTGQLAGASVYAVGAFKGSLEDLYATWKKLREERATADKQLGGGGIVKDLDAQIAAISKQYQIKKQELDDIDKDLEYAEIRRSRGAKQEQGPKITISGESDKSKAEKALQAQKAQYEMQVEGARDNYAKLTALDDAYLQGVIKRYGKGSAEYFAQLKEMEQHNREHMAKLGTDGEAALRRSLDNYKREAENTKANYELQTKLAEDADTDTATKYSRIEALDQQYLTFITDMYDEGSTEYLNQLRVMEEHHKQHLDAKKKDEEDYARNVREINDMVRGWDEEAARKSKGQAEKYASDASKVIGETFRAGLGKGGTAGKALNSFADGMLQQLGGIFIKMGEKSVAASPALALIRAGLSNIFTAPEASLAGGLALIALGEALDAIGSGGSGGGSGGGPVGPAGVVNFGSSISLGGANSTNSATTAGSVVPVNPVSLTVIGPQDPQAQRQILELVRNANRR